MGAFFNGVIVTVGSAPGTGSTISLGPAATINGSTYLTFAQGGATNGQLVDYSIIDPTNGGTEEGIATYSSTGPSLTGRTVVTSSNGNAAINASANSLVRSSPLASTLNDASLITTGTMATARLGSGTASSSTFLRGDSSWVVVASGFTSLYTSSQTITIPTGMTKAFVTMVGASGASGGVGSNGGGGAGALMKALTGLTAGNTLSGTVGAGGTGNGGNSTLSSGTQTITTLTANGGQIGSAGGTGGSASNGDLNRAGGQGSPNYPGTSGLGLSTGADPGTNNPGISGFIQIMWAS